MTIIPDAFRQSSLRLKDGRSLAWHEFGSPSGTPALFCTGAGMLGSLGFGASALERQGFRLIAIDRPGLGGSTSHPQKNFSTWCDDVSELLKHLSISAPPVVGFSQGAPFAFSLAHAGMAGALAIVSGQDDFSDPGVRSLLPPQAASFVTQIQSRDPGFLQQFSRMADAAGFFELILSMSSEKDRSLYAGEPFRFAYLKCLNEGFQQGSAGYVQDLVNALGPWPFELEKILIPVDFWYGRLDANPTHSPDFGVSLSKRLPRHTHTLLDDEGGSLLWTRAEEILQTLSRHL